MSGNDAGNPLDSAKDFAEDAGGKARDFAEDAAENVKGLGARIAGLFKHEK